MSKKFESSLVGRTVTPRPPKTMPDYHMNDELPQGVVYKIHTVYLEKGEPVAMAEKIDALPDLIGGKNPERFEEAPQSAKLWVGTLGMLWELKS